MMGAELLERGPFLPCPADELPLVLTDRTPLRRRLALGELGAAGDADRIHSLCQTPFFRPARPRRPLVRFSGAARVSGSATACSISGRLSAEPSAKSWFLSLPSR